MRYISQCFDVANIASWISNAFAEDGFRIVVNQAFDGGRLVALGKSHCDAEAGQKVSKESISGAVNLRHRDDIVSEFGNVQHRVMQCGLPSADAERRDSLFERRDAPLEDLIGGITDAA
jgi:hypothetical protein